MMKKRPSLEMCFIAFMTVTSLSFSSFLLTDDADAHPPSSVVLEYFIMNATLKVTITHNSPTPNYHYIGTVDIMKNGALDTTYQYTDQPTNSVFTYEYTVQAGNGDVLSARAVCSIAGELTGELTVVGPVLPLSLEISPRISNLDEGAARDFTINAYSGSDPVDGVELTVTSSHGTQSTVEPLGIGGYQFTYTAPSVDTDTDETITLAGQKNGYEDATAELSFLIVDSDSTDRIRVEFVDPPKSVEEGSETILSLLVNAGGDPVSGATVDVESTSGSTDAAEEGGPGEYSFAFTAPDISADTKVTIKVTARSPPLQEGTATLQITIEALKKALDGRITDGEYEHWATVASGEMEVHWRFSGTDLNMALKARTTGWIAVGIGASSFMKDADVVLGYVDGSGKAVVLDCFSTGNYGPHPPDPELGGADNLIAAGGSESGGWTTIEFSRPLNSPDDRFDNDIDASVSTKIIWAIGSSDDPSAQHGGTDIIRGHYQMDWSKSGDAGSGDKNVSMVGIVLGCLGALLAIFGASVLLTRKKGWPGDALKKGGIKEGMLPVIGMISVIIAASAVILAIVMLL